MFRLSLIILFIASLAGVCIAATGGDSETDAPAMPAAMMPLELPAEGNDIEAIGDREQTAGKAGPQRQYRCSLCVGWWVGEA